MAKKPKRVTKKWVQANEKKPYVPKVDVQPEVDDDDCGDDGLTIKQRLFVEAITGPALGNATKAARMAGYRSDNYLALKQTATENLAKPSIKEAIRLALARKRGGAEWTRLSIIDLARSSMENFLVVGPDGKKTFDFEMAAAAGALGQIKEYEEKETKDADGNTVILPKIKCHDRIQALALLARMHGLIDDRPAPSIDELLEIDPALAAAEPTRGAIPSLPRDNAVQDSSGGPTIRQDGSGQAQAGNEPVGLPDKSPPVG